MRVEEKICSWNGYAAIVGDDPSRQRAILLFNGNLTPVTMMWRGDVKTITALLESDYPQLKIVTIGELRAEIDYLKNFGVNSDAPQYELEQVAT